MEGVHKAVDIRQQRVRGVATILIGVFEVGYGFLYAGGVLVPQGVRDGEKRGGFQRRRFLRLRRAGMILVDGFDGFRC